MYHLQGIKHISFDLWLTLIKSNPEFKPLRNQLFAKHFNVRKPEEAVAASFRHFDVLFNSINEKIGNNIHYSEMLFVILDNLGVPIESISQSDMEAYYKEMETLFFNYHPQLMEPETANILTGLQDKNISISILSNTGFILGSSLRKLLNHLDIETYFCFQLYSDEMGHSKPSQKVFESVLKEIQHIKTIEKQEVLHVGDNPISDIAGSQQFGFKPLLLNSENTLRKLFN
jgi:putative hydrolase of the HAD superfamily